MINTLRNKVSLLFDSGLSLLMENNDMNGVDLSRLHNYFNMELLRWKMGKGID